MNPVRIASSDWKSYKCYGLWYALSSKRVRLPPIFVYVLNLILSFSTCSQSFNKICVWEVLDANVLKYSIEEDKQKKEYGGSYDSAEILLKHNYPTEHWNSRYVKRKHSQRVCGFVFGNQSTVTNIAKH